MALTDPTAVTQDQSPQVVPITPPAQTPVQPNAQGQLPPPGAPGDVTPQAPISATGAPAGPLPANPTSAPPAPVAATPKTRRATLMSTLKDFAHAAIDNLGGPSETPGVGPHGETNDVNGNPLPTVHHGAGERIAHALGTEAVGIGAGLGAARGPGGFGKAAAAASTAVLNLQERNKSFVMQMHQQHANDLVAYRQQSAENEQSMQKNAAEAAPLRDVMHNATDILAPIKNGAPMTAQELFAYAQNQQSKGYGVDNILHVAAPPEKNGPSDKNPDGIGSHPMFYAYIAKNPRKMGDFSTESVAQQKVPINDKELSATLGVATNSSVPLYLLAKASTENAMINNTTGAIQHSLETNGIDASKLPTPPKMGQERSDLGDALRELAMEPGWQNGGDPTVAFEQLQAKHPEMANLVAPYFGGVGNIKSLHDTITDTNAKREQINLNPDLAPATQGHKDSLSKTIDSSTKLTQPVKDALKEELNQDGLTAKDFSNVTQHFITAQFAADELAQKQVDTQADIQQRDREAALKYQEPNAPLTDYWQGIKKTFTPQQQSQLDLYNSRIQATILNAAVNPGSVDIDAEFSNRANPKPGELNRADAWGLVAMLNPAATHDSYATAHQAHMDAVNPNKTGGQVAALNNFMGHAAEAKDQIDNWVSTHKNYKVAGLNVPLVNATLNQLRGKIGDSDYNSVLLSASIARDEFLNLIKSGAVPKELEEKYTQQITDPLTMSPGQIQNLYAVMGSMVGTRANTIDSQYFSATGGSHFPNLINGSNVENAKKLGINVEGFNSGGQITGGGGHLGAITNNTGESLGTGPKTINGLQAPANLKPGQYFVYNGNWRAYTPEIQKWMDAHPGKGVVTSIGGQQNNANR